LTENIPHEYSFEILRALPLSDVIRLTWLVLKAKSIKDRTPFDNITAKEWIIDTAGESVYNNFFLPLLQSKFGDNKEKVSAACFWGESNSFQQGNTGGTIGYMRGGFERLFKKWQKRSKKGGIIKHAVYCRIKIVDGSIKGVIVDDELIECDRVISTLRLMLLRNNRYKAMDIMDISYQGTACALFGLTKRYWMISTGSISKRTFHLVRHRTQYFIPESDYHENLMYVTTYFQNTQRHSLEIKR